MLWVDPTGFVIRNVKEAGIELVDVLQESTLPRVHLARFFLITVEAIDVPAIRGNLTHRIDFVHQVVPILFVMIRAWKAAAEPNDGDVFFDLSRDLRKLSRVIRLRRFLPRCSVFGIGRQEGAKVFTNRINGRMVEQQGWPQFKLVSKSHLQARTKFYGHQGIQPHFDQRSVRFGGSITRQDFLKKALHGRDDLTKLFVGSKFTQLGDQLRVPSTRLLSRCNQFRQEPGRLAIGTQFQLSPIDIDNDGVATGQLLKRTGHRSMCTADFERRDTLNFETSFYPFIIRHTFGPRTPVDGQSGQAQMPPMIG